MQLLLTKQVTFHLFASVYILIYYGGGMEWSWAWIIDEERLTIGFHARHDILSIMQ